MPKLPRGVPREVVKSLARELCAACSQALELEWAIRKRVQGMYASPGANKHFWRNSLRFRFRREMTEGDYAAIPRWDETAASINAEFGGVLGQDNPSQALYELMKEPCPRTPRPSDFYEEALRLLGYDPDDDQGEVPF